MCVCSSLPHNPQIQPIVCLLFIFNSSSYFLLSESFLIMDNTLNPIHAHTHTHTKHTLYLSSHLSSFSFPILNLNQGGNEKQIQINFYFQSICNNPLVADKSVSVKVKIVFKTNVIVKIIKIIGAIVLWKGINQSFRFQINFHEITFVSFTR